MRSIVHISDIHFGRIAPVTLQPLVSMIRETAPDVVVVSGDLTQRARSSQFAAARSFLAQIPFPLIVVPGNHDIPLYNVFRRFLTPLRSYRSYISEELNPFYQDEEIAVLGINTARSLTFKEGRISCAQIDAIRSRLCQIDNRIAKILVTHHPLHLPSGISGETAGRSGLALEAVATCHVDLLLAGHYHFGDTGCTAASSGTTALVIQAGTATSTRGRGRPNSFNIIRVDLPEVVVERIVWSAPERRFIATVHQRFYRSDTGWNCP